MHHSGTITAPVTTPVTTTTAIATPTTLEAAPTILTPTAALPLHRCATGSDLLLRPAEILREMLHELDAGSCPRYTPGLLPNHLWTMRVRNGPRPYTLDTILLLPGHLLAMRVCE